MKKFKDIFVLVVILPILFAIVSMFNVGANEEINGGGQFYQIALGYLARQHPTLS